MLQWFAEDSVVAKAISGRLIEENEVETRPERVSSSCLDENVSINRIQKYFTHDAWSAVLHVVDVVKMCPVYYCGRCITVISDETESSVRCDSCLNWLHFKCASIKQKPKTKLWFCRSCYNL